MGIQVNQGHSDLLNASFEATLILVSTWMGDCYSVLLLLLSSREGTYVRVAVQSIPTPDVDLSCPRNSGTLRLRVSQT